jgi:predicted dehydrogenase
MSSKPKDLSRRQFLADSGKAAVGLAAAGTLASCAGLQPAPAVKSRPIGANERINIASVGIRAQGFALAQGFAKIDNVRIKTIVDIDENLYAERVKKLEEIQGTAPSTEYDMRRAFDDKDIDAVVIAVPNHWHALAAIWACQAGKHVYVEKPCSHNIFEGRKMVEAARRYNRIVCVGFQNRSRRDVRQAIKFLHDGKLGEIYMARGLCFKPRDSIGSFPDGPMPDSSEEMRVGFNRTSPYTRAYLKNVHYDMWIGCAPKRPFNRNRFHYNWHWQWDYGNGDIGNQGPHQFDIARWGLNESCHPVKVHSAGGYFAFESDQQTPNTQTAAFEYADGKILQFEVRGLYTNGENDIEIGNLFYGTEGWMSLSGGSWKTYFGRKNEPGPSSETAEEVYDPMVLVGTGSGSHYENFIGALRSGNKDDLTCDIEVGYMSTALPHLANISYRLGRKLTFDGCREKFVGDGKANRMLARKYRKPYVVPDRV